MSSSFNERMWGREDEEIEHLYYPCSSFMHLPPSEIILTCECCETYSMVCCQHPVEEGSRACHHYKVVYIDGACINNGRRESRAGIGCAMGASTSADSGHQISIPINDTVDETSNDSRKTSQRAELLAGYEGIKMLARRHVIEESRGQERDTKEWIIVADSEYLVKGMTVWLPTWKENGLRTSRGKAPGNLDLFLKLDDAIAYEESTKGVEIYFYHIPREYNSVADGLAKRAAQVALPSLAL